MAFIYFAKCGARRSFKIGYSKTPNLRMRSIFLEIGQPVKLIGVKSGDWHHEGYIHLILREHSCIPEHKSWYHDRPEVRALIDEVLSLDFRWGPWLRATKKQYNNQKILKKAQKMAAKTAPISKIFRENIGLLAFAYSKATGASLTQISKDFYGNAGFFKLFLKGEQSISVRRIERMMNDFAERWPENAEWPFLRSIIFKTPVRRKRRKTALPDQELPQHVGENN